MFSGLLPYLCVPGSHCDSYFSLVQSLDVYRRTHYGNANIAIFMPMLDTHPSRRRHDQGACIHVRLPGPVYLSRKDNEIIDCCIWTPLQAMTR